MRTVIALVVVVLLASVAQAQQHDSAALMRGFKLEQSQKKGLSIQERMDLMYYHRFMGQACGHAK